MERARTIAHFDLDSFFVSVEILKDPSLKGKAVIVGGQERGVVAACSYEARRFGIHSAMPSSQARRLCPHALFVKGSYEDYSRYSRWVTQIIAAKAPLFEKASVDEFYLDLSGMDKFFHPLSWTIALREYIIRETGLPISFGLGCNKMIAKIATNQAKPNGYLQILPGKEKDFLAPLPVHAIPGVGKHTTETLNNMGIIKIEQLWDAGHEFLQEHLGKGGVDLWQKSNGIHHGVVSAYHEAKSISTERTFNENITDLKLLHKELVRQAEKVCFELRQDAKVAGCVAIKIRYPDFTTSSRQTSLPLTALDDEIIPLLKELFIQLYKKGQPVRLLGVKLSELTNDATQTNLFIDAEKKSMLYKSIDEVKSRFGKSFIRRASSD